MGKVINRLDGKLEDQIADLKDFFGLRPDQTFQDLDVEPLEDDEDDE
ncbi:MAG: hypothetical protein LUG85_08325 [Clostridiales bacterium]|nr:hypothetical protein [Clostridiales bacterium]